MNYDEHWHVFVAQQDTRAGLAGEWRATAHPPLYYWLLRLPVSLARTRLLDRSISLLAGVAAVFVMGHIVLTLTSGPAAPLLAALALALSPSAVLISSEGRSYMLSAFFILLAFSYYLSLLRGSHSLRAAFGFSVSSCLALMSHYFTAFFVLACVAGGLYTAVVHPLSRADMFRLCRDRWTSFVIATLPILLAAGWLYRTHVRSWLRPQSHVQSFYYHPESGQRLLDYLVAAAFNTFNLFSPVPLGRAASVPVFVVSVAFVAVTLVYLFRIQARSEDGLRFLPVLFLTAIGGGLLIASVRGAYPFGGDLRQQFILLPFLLITASILADATISRLRTRGALLAWFAVAGICLNSVLHLRHLDRAGRDGFSTMFAKEMALYHQTFPEPGAVYLDQFNLIVFFAHHDQRQWRSLDFSRYEVAGAGAPIVVLRDRARWNVNLLDERVYADIAARLQSSGLEATTVFSLRYPLPSEPLSPVEQHAFRQEVPTLAARHHLEVERLVVDGFTVLAQVRRKTVEGEISTP